MTLDEVIGNVKSVVARIATVQVMGVLVTAAPFLALPIINQVTAFIVGKILSAFLDKTELGAFILRTNAMTAAQAADYVSAQKKLEEAKNDEEKRAAEAELIASTRRLISLVR